MQPRIAALLVVLSLPPTLFAGTASTVSEKTLKGFEKYREIPGAARVGEDTCLSCHEHVAKAYQHAFHKQQGLECEDCHGNGSLHVEGGGDKSKIVSFKARSAQDANGVCLSCHTRDQQLRHWTSGSHSANHLRCTDCHQVHPQGLQAATADQQHFSAATQAASGVSLISPETNVFLRSPADTNNACLKCHQSQAAQMSMPYHHPLLEGKLSCVDCHDPHGGPNGKNLKVSNVNQLCLSCHAQYRGPFAYQHPPVTENCMICHSAHGSPNLGLLNVSMPALCLQCHAGHHNGASLPLPDRCTNCHGSIHGTDTPTPSGGSRFIDKGPTDPSLMAGNIGPVTGVRSGSAGPMMQPVASHASTYGTLAGTAAFGMAGSVANAPLSGASFNDQGGGPGSPGIELTGANSAYSISEGYRFLDGTGYLGRAGQYDSLQQSVGGNLMNAYVSTQAGLTEVSRANIISGDDYDLFSQVTKRDWFQAGFQMRGLVQQQENVPFYAFPVLDVPPGATTPPDTYTNLIAQNALFGVRRRLGNAYARVKLPKLPVYLFVKGDWQARSGTTQLGYLDENSYVSTPGFTQFCGAQCHYQSQYQPVNYTTRNIAGGADIDLGNVRLAIEHKFSSFNDRLMFPAGTFTGPFTPESDSFGFSSTPGYQPPSGPTPVDVPASPNGSLYNIDIPSPSQYSADSLSLNWAASPKFTLNGSVSYTRLSDTYTRNSQNIFNTDETANWMPLDKLRVMVDYHQNNLINDFTPYYSLYGNVSYHDHSEGVRLEYELPKNFDAEVHYTRSGITRSNAALWNNTAYNLFGSQIYSVDNTDLLKVVPASTSNTAGLALRYHDRGLWSARAGYEWTGTNDPGYLVVPQDNNRLFANLWLSPAKWISFSNDLDIIVQNNFDPVPLPYTPGVTPLTMANPPMLPATGSFGINIAGLPSNFQRRDRFYIETASANLHLVPAWNMSLGYSYQQNNLNTYMAFQNDSATGYILDEALVPYKQITQAYWGETNYTVKQRLVFNLRLVYNSSSSGMRPSTTLPTDPTQLAQFESGLGNSYLISQSMFDPNGLFPSALNNVQFAATQISEVEVPQWIGISKASYTLPHQFEGGMIFTYNSYRDYWNPYLNGVLRTFNVYVGKSW